MADLGDDWYDSEESTARGMIAELQRIRRRFRARPIIVILVAALITGAIWKKLSSKQPLREATVILAITEEALSTKNREAIPVDELRDYVTSVLLPAKELNGMIEKRNLYPLRKSQGTDFAIGQLWEQTEIEIWRNSFVDYDEADEDALKSARIGITVTDVDPDKAFGIARDLAQIIIKTATTQRQALADALSGQVSAVRIALEARQNQLVRETATKLVALADARKLDDRGIEAALELEVANLYAEQKRVSGQLDRAVSSKDAIADRISAAGLDMSIEVVEEQPPERDQPRGFIQFLILSIVGVGALFGAALVIGAFDPRIHDTDDVERLHLPVLGHVPGFSGDHVGSLEARGARASRVPSFLRWRSHR